MDGLKALDHVAYIRFASIYKDFSDPGDFAEIAERVEKEALAAGPRQIAVSGATKPRHRPRPPAARPEYRQGGAGDAQFRADRDAPGRARATAGPIPTPDRPRAAPTSCSSRRRSSTRVAEAIADCSTVFASTVRRRDLVMPVVAPEAMADAIAPPPSRTAILFGPERSGLETEEVALANAIVTVPINPEFGSLNLAQAVILLAYEWSKRSALAQPPAKDPSRPPRTASSKV